MLNIYELNKFDLNSYYTYQNITLKDSTSMWNKLLLEDDGCFLLEDGNYMLLEK